VLVLIDDLNQIDMLVNAYRFIFPRVILLRSQTGGYDLSHLRPLDFMDLLGLQVKNNLLDGYAQAYKRVIDILASFIFGLLLAPLLGLIAVLIRLDSAGGVFYRQARLGRDGREFNVLKFRTMHLSSDQVFRDALARDPALREEWAQYQKMRADPRVTRIGRLLRRFSLDELPQLWNIARGEMSLVGPRPIVPEQRPLYGAGFEQYQAVAPGITGLWQVSGRNETTFAQRAALDVEYIQRWSLWLDIFIVLKTVKVVLARNGAW
jgi:Undecaprenyl-phosphate galactose phosphotransferase WbaP